MPEQRCEDLCGMEEEGSGMREEKTKSGGRRAVEVIAIGSRSNSVHTATVTCSSDETKQKSLTGPNNACPFSAKRQTNSFNLVWDRRRALEAGEAGSRFHGLTFSRPNILHHE